MELFPNGRIYFNDPSGAPDIDALGIPQRNDTFSKNAICTIEVQSESRNSVGEDGVHPSASYTIYVDESRVPDRFKPSKVKIEHDEWYGLGTFTVQRIVHHKLTRTYQLWV